MLGIRREEKNKWERRVPLVPSQVAKLVAEGVKVLVEPSPNRCYPDQEYAKAGATITEDLSAATVIMGVKEVPIDKLLSDKTYLFFAHIIKAQDYNMPLMDVMLARNIRLFDYECIRALPAPHPRLVAFGDYAGKAGMADFFRGLGEFLLQIGHATPFIHQGSCYMYPDLERVKLSIKTFGEMIADQGLPPALSPMVFCFTSNGLVSRGAQDMFKLLPHEFINPDELEGLLANPPPDARHKVYGTIVEGKHMVARKDGGEFDKAEYYAKPELYRPVFHERYAKHISIIVNCMFWDYKFPRVLTCEQMKSLDGRLVGVCDITCDYKGSVEFLTHFTSIEEPFVVYDPEANKIKMKIGEASPGDVLYHAVDHLPAELPREASEHFGSCVLPFVKQLMAGGKLSQEMENACVLQEGKLCKNYEYIAKLRVYNAKLRAEEEAAEEEKQQEDQKWIFELHGHLFDKMLFNKTLDVLEKAGLHYRVLQWEVGLTVSEQSQVSLEVGRASAEARKAIQALCGELGGEYFEGGR